MILHVLPVQVLPPIHVLPPSYNIIQEILSFYLYGLTTRLI